MFHPPSGLATIEDATFSSCQSLKRLLIPATGAAVQGKAFEASGMSSIEIEDGSVSFRVLNNFFVGFEGRSLNTIRMAQCGTRGSLRPFETEAVIASWLPNGHSHWMTRREKFWMNLRRIFVLQ
jgi:hypothetical protein